MYYRWPQSNIKSPPPRVIDWISMTTSPYDSTHKPFVFSPSIRIFGFLNSGLRSVNQVVSDDQIFEHFIWNIGARTSPLIIGKWHLAYPLELSAPQKLLPYKQKMICGPTTKWMITVNKWILFSIYSVQMSSTYSQMDLLICTSLPMAYWRQFLRFVSPPWIVVSLPMKCQTLDPNQLRQRYHTDKTVCFHRIRMENSRILFDRLN